MRIITTILLTLLSLGTFCQVDTFKFNLSDETGVKRYEVQKTFDTTKEWTHAGYVSRGKSPYKFTIPPVITIPVYYRIQVPGIITGTPILLTATNGVVISNLKISSTYITWTTKYEVNVKNFLIEKSSDGKSWSLTSPVKPKGDGNYSYRYSRTVKKYTYRVIPVFLNGLKGQFKKFK